jgi:hypothetical protein
LFNVFNTNTAIIGKNPNGGNSFIMYTLSKLGLKETTVPKKEQTLKTIEILVVGMLVGAICVPGGHRQFILWYSQMIPFALEMTGLPYWASFWIYPAVFPPDHCSWNHKYMHHIVTIVLALWLLFVGSKRDKHVNN